MSYWRLINEWNFGLRLRPLNLTICCVYFATQSVQTVIITCFAGVSVCTGRQGSWGWWGGSGARGRLVTFLWTSLRGLNAFHSPGMAVPLIVGLCLTLKWKRSFKLVLLAQCCPQKLRAKLGFVLFNFLKVCIFFLHLTGLYFRTEILQCENKHQGLANAH